MDSFLNVKNRSSTLFWSCPDPVCKMPQWEHCRSKLQQTFIDHPLGIRGYDKHWEMRNNKNTQCLRAFIVQQEKIRQMPNPSQHCILLAHKNSFQLISGFLGNLSGFSLLHPSFDLYVLWWIPVRHLFSKNWLFPHLYGHHESSPRRMWHPSPSPGKGWCPWASHTPNLSQSENLLPSNSQLVQRWPADGPSRLVRALLWEFGDKKKGARLFVASYILRCKT